MKIYIPIICTLAMAAITCSNQHRLTPLTRTQTSLSVDATVANREWMLRGWSGNDKPFQEIRERIDKSLAGGQNANILLAQYKQSTLLRPDDDKAVFAWGYAAWCSLKALHTYEEKFKNLAGVDEALAKAPLPQTYNYVRLRFLIQACEWCVPQLKIVGERLIQHDSNDYDVKFELVRVLDTTFSSQYQQQALMYSKDLIRADPKRANPYTLLAGFYEHLYSKYHKPNDGYKAIALYQRYLQLAPLNEEYREDASRIIGGIQRQLAEQAKK